MTPLIVIECNLIGIKRDFFFYGYELSHSVACNFSEDQISELLGTSNKIISKQSTRQLAIDKSPLKITNRGLLIKTFKVFCVPSMM